MNRVAFRMKEGDDDDLVVLLSKVETIGKLTEKGRLRPSIVGKAFGSSFALRSAV